MSGHWLTGQGGKVFVCVGVALSCLQCGNDGGNKSAGTSAQAGTPGSAGSAGNEASSGGNDTSSGGSESTAAGTSATSGGSGGAAQETGGASQGGGGASAGSGGIPATGGTPSVEWPNEGCGKLALHSNVTVADANVDRFTYGDSGCKPRTASMARLGKGFLRQVTYQLASGATRTVTGSGKPGTTQAGFGFTSNHNLPNEGGTDGTFRAVFVGDYHAVYEYTFEVAAKLPVTLQWVFATGRDHPLIGITYDMTKRDKGIGADTRTPYGDLAWDGDDNAGKTQVSGVGWGDRYKFITTKAPLTKNSTWDYTQANLVPYVIEWTDAPDAEMGLVQTQTWEQKDAGGYWHYANWGKTSENQTRTDDQVGLMPVLYNWTYQLNQYQLCATGSDEGCDVDKPTGSHRMAWGANFGAIGGKNADGKYPAYGDDKQLSGYPYQSYAVFMVLGEHSKAPVFAQVSDVEVIQGTHLSASVGTVASMVPGGVGRTDLVAATPTGYDHRFSAWSIRAEQNRAVFRMVIDKGALKSPLFVVSGFTATTAPNLIVDGVPLRAGVDYFMSIDTKAQELWITLAGNWTGAHDITLVKPL